MLAPYFWILMSGLGALAFVNLKKNLLAHLKIQKSFLLFLSVMLLALVMLISYYPKDICYEHAGFIFTRLSLSLTCLILFLSIAIQNFSLKYMQIEADKRPFFFKLTALTITSMGLCVSNHSGLVVLFWVFNQILLSKLIAHISTWKEAQASGKLYLKTALIGSLLLAVALVIVCYDSQSFYLSELKTSNSLLITSAMILLSLAAMIQAGSWPFHKWLISSLNSPTPVSAFMHAGLVSSGGCLLIRLGSLFANSLPALNFLFLLGTLSVILATVMKLMQSSVKKMLAFSTVSQMGYMFMQIGLGLLPQAFAHIVSHSLFKGFLFLNSGSHIQKSTKSLHKARPSKILFATFCALLSGFYFSLVMKLPLSSKASCIMLVFPMIAAFQMSLGLIETLKIKSFFLAPLASLFMGSIYAFLMQSVETFLPSYTTVIDLNLSWMHYSAFIIIVITLFVINLSSMTFFNTSLGKKIYVLALNHSQSTPKTVSSSRNTFTL